MRKARATRLATTYSRTAAWLHYHRRIEGLTSVFGMGTCVSPRLWSPECRSGNCPIRRGRRRGSPRDGKKSLTYGDASVAEKYENGERKHMKQTVRIISIGWLNPLLRLHLRPINLVVSQDPLWPEGQRRSYLGNSLALRCFQRLSSPCLATRRCR